MTRLTILRVLLLMLLTGTSVVIIAYYWQHQDLGALTNVSLYVMLCALIYVLLQMTKRYFFREQHWWDWLYYIGLMAMMLPNFFAKEATLAFYNLLADAGTLFLVFPLIIDIWAMLQSKEK